ncbi:MAG: hypothetical protein EB084_12535 [Proteobacteria bacterium]|nr:hypothetical protein [Pseudomonadota bacterium]
MQRARAMPRQASRGVRRRSRPPRWRRIRPHRGRRAAHHPIPECLAAPRPVARLSKPCSRRQRRPAAPRRPGAKGRPRR